METTSSKKSNVEAHTTEEQTVKGTIFSVGIVGAVIFITYIVIYGLYMVRV